MATDLFSAKEARSICGGERACMHVFSLGKFFFSVFILRRYTATANVYVSAACWSRLGWRMGRNEKRKD